jgi:hypothetical protein
MFNVLGVGKRVRKPEKKEKEYVPLKAQSLKDKELDMFLVLGFMVLWS